MRLLHRMRNGRFELTKDLAEGMTPKYAILSHTWLSDDEEVNFDDVTQGIADSKPKGYAKILFCGEQAAKDGLEYFWVDTCCINKDSSAEMQETITSMFSWYEKAVKCYAYLSDVSVPEAPDVDMDSQYPSYPWELAFRGSRWFTRGWTLQELLAPKTVEFFSCEGTRLGDKKTLEQYVHEVTGIPLRALRGDDLTTFSVAERLFWAQNRDTKRKEDQAYCLLGIFKIFMPLMYGEGDHASFRLREEIDKKHAENARLDSLLAKLPIASEATFNSFNNQHEPTCLKNTRTELLQTIDKWASGSDKRCIFWLNGIAGTGKSTIARTVARTFHDRGNLGASFFFSRGGGDLSNATRLITTLARQLATRVPYARRYICEAIMEQQEIASQSLRDQWDQLILKPLSRMNGKSCPSTLVLVLDALDELDSERDIQVILRILATSRTLTNIQLRIFITSRPEVSVRVGLRKIPEVDRREFVLHEIEPSLVDRDLSLFFESKLSTIREERGFDEDWPGNQTIKRLVEISCGLFIWASTACRFIREGRRLAMRRIKNLIHGHRAGEGPEKQLDQIYTYVLQGSIQQDYNEKERAELYEILREVLGSIVILFSPLSMDSLAELLHIPLSDIKMTLVDLHTIFHIPSQTSRPIRLHHPTFRDFLLDKDRCSDLDFWVDEKEAHKALGDSCITLMTKMLKRDICSLGSPGTRVQDIDPDLIEQRIPPELQYACLYWAQHYRQSKTHFRDNDRVDRFFREYFLYWLEVVNLLGKSSEGEAIVRLYHSLLVPGDNVLQMPFLSDARQFLLTFQSIIKESPLQIYCAALAFIPPSNQLRNHFWDQMHPWIRDLRIAEAIIPASKDQVYFVNDVAFTPDSKRVAAGSFYQIVRLWDTATKAAIGKFEGPTDRVSSIAISPDGTMISAGSDDFTVMTWDMRTGKLLYSLNAHTRWVNSVVFSPDGKLLASGSMDETIALWDAATGREVKRLFNQSSCVNDTTFSADGSLIAAGSFDEMIRIWEVSGDPDNVPLMLDGHSGCVNSVKFSKNGQRIISGSDDLTIKVWNAITGAEIMSLRGHTKKVISVAFSLDCSQIVSGSGDKTIKVWDANSGALLHTLREHTSGINAVAFSPNGRLFGSASFDDEVRLWDTKTWQLLGELEDFRDPVDVEEPEVQLIDVSSSDQEHTPVANIEFKGHSSAVTNVIISPNSQLLASSSQDGTINLWQKEGVACWKVQAHTGPVNTIAFSPDSRLIASAATDKYVKLWNTDTGTPSAICRGHESSVLAVVFSSDGLLLASCSADKTVRLWAARAGEPLGRLEGHSDAVKDIAFSPTSRNIASCSADATIIIWDLQTHTAVTTLRGHLGPVSSIAFSADGELLVSCSEDATVRLWSIYGAAYGVIRGDALQINSVAFSSNNQLVASSSSDGAVRLWDPETQAARGLLQTDAVIRRMNFSPHTRYIETDRGVLDISSFSSPLLRALSNRSNALFVTEEWLKKDLEKIIWLPDGHHATCGVTWDTAMAMGDSSGRITFVYF